ncbi:MAG: Ig-like domain-containing protein [Methylobacter sp.]
MNAMKMLFIINRLSDIITYLPASGRHTSRMAGMVLACFLSALTSTGETQAADTPFLTIVSLTFDDGLKQSGAIAPLIDTGLKGTFYINSDQIRLSGLIDNRDYLTKGELDTLYSYGNEIGGHTIGHVNLATLTDNDQKNAICNDRQNLLNWGYDVHSFAYPYSSTGPTTQSIIMGGCPIVTPGDNGKYQSARAVGGIGCPSCPYAESLQPVNPYYIEATESVTSTTTLADMQNYITQAETHGGGWLTLIFHSVCDGCSDSLNVTPSTFRALLVWLKDREAQGTYVRTVRQVMSGDIPAPPPPPPVSSNLLINPSLEQDLDNNTLPDCWQRGDWGSSTANWTRTTDSYTGNFAQRVQITAYNNGDRKLLPALDAGQNQGGCAPSMEADAIYQISAYYKATTSTTVVLFYLNANNAWQYWLDGPKLAASSNWAQMTHYIDSLPAGAKAVSFGIALSGVGTLTTDEYTLAKVLDSVPPLNTAPSFTGGSTSLTILQDSPALDIKPNLRVSDTDSGQTLTWSQSTAPTHGTLAISGATATSGSSAITPGGTLTYQPTPGYSGSDSFSIQVSDGIATATRSFAITVTANNPPPVGSNLLINPSLELDLDNNTLPDCWQRGDWGSSTATWTRTNDAHSGSFAQRLQITAYSNGDRKLLPTMDNGQNAGACAPSVDAGAAYQISAYYKSSGTPTVVLFYLNTSGNWTYWKDGPKLAASTDWAQMSFNTGTLPTDAKALSFGIALNSVGTLTTDDYSLTPISVNPPSTNTAPTFVGGSTNLSIKRNSAATNLKPNLIVSDTDTGQTLTWRQRTAPAHGTLTLSNATASSGGSTISPGGTVTYQPARNYTGSDSFSVEVSDGIATTARNFAVTIRR